MFIMETRSWGVSCFWITVSDQSISISFDTSVNQSEFDIDIYLTDCCCLSHWGSGYYDPESAEMYGGQDLNSMYLAAYNGAQASMAWQFQQQMMGGMLMQMQQMQMNQRLQVAKAQRARQAAVQKEKAEKAEAKAKAQAAQAAQHAREAERVRVAAEALMRLKSQNSQSQGKPSGSSLGSGSELPNIGSTLLKELNGFNSQNAPTFNSALGSLGSVGSVLSAAATAKAPVKPTATAATGDASSQSTKVGRCGKKVEET